MFESPDQHTTESLIPHVYDELRRIAARQISQLGPMPSISGTVLVHEAFLRLDRREELRWANRRHLIAATAEAMRCILIDHIRAKRRLKRGGDYHRVSFEEIEITVPNDDGKLDGRLLEIDGALDEFTQVDSDGAELVKLRFFVGMTLEEAAEFLGVSVRTASRRWSYARAWLIRHLSE